MPRMGAVIGFGVICAMCVGPARATVVVPTDKPTIAEGLAWASTSNDHHVLVLPGIYVQNATLVVPEEISLEGSGASYTRIVGQPGQPVMELGGWNEIANLTVEGGLDGMAWHENDLTGFAVHDVWFVDQAGAPLLMPGGGYIELEFERNVIVRPRFPVEILVEGDSEVWIRNNHFVGTATEDYLKITFEGNGLFGNLEVTNNIFENGSEALDVFAYTTQPMVVQVANNTFNDNLNGLTVECLDMDSVLLEVQNNWFHDNWLGADFGACSLFVQAAGWLDYNGWGLNTTDLGGATWGAHALFDTPTYIGVVADELHPDDNYDLLVGTVGINEGFGVGYYNDADDGTRNDIGSYGGPHNENWNWDGDAWLFVDDCDDRNPATFPGAGELCDGLDNDCDGTLSVDERDSDGDGLAICEGDCDDSDPALQHDDADGDGVSTCDGDCDDTNPMAWPGMAEECDGVDNNCDGQIPPNETIDGDSDGFPQCADCEDGQPGVYPGANEVCDGWDSDCDGVVPIDEQDGDGDGAWPCDGDCDDTRPDLHHWDDDHDGISSCDGDCDDHDGDINPDAEEVCDDGVDNDCDELIDEEDPDCGVGDDDDAADDDDDAADDDDDAADDDDDAADDDDDVVADDDDTGSADDDDSEEPAADDDDVPGGFQCECSVTDGGAIGSVWLAGGLAVLGLRRRRG